MMRIACFTHAHERATGLVDEVRAVVRPVRESLADLVAGALPTPDGRTLPLADVLLRAPLTADCRGLLCTGINYVEHQRESADTFVADVPVDPIVFFKTPSAVADPGAVLELDERVSEQFDWEVELGVVIGLGGRDIPVEDAGRHVFGYTVVNDVTARDVQHRHKQWHLGKNVDAATPVGPWIVTADELGYPPAAGIELAVNGVVKQRAHTRDMIFTVAEQIAVISRYVALRPGDVLATGTPSGVGFARTPAEFLRHGDVVEARIDGIGLLRNEIRVPAVAPSEVVVA
ncbi:fumarylacetoacetate hydrolase family protein [Pseudonocardia ailaonensis]|uniref:Fumarylacetoacetate hydrolase family protein n=1 Tax=Pseudonocardia ailaonensis TaxID=367279 RepID=A0ABN2N3D6_9PSEU